MSSRLAGTKASKWASNAEPNRAMPPVAATSGIAQQAAHAAPRPRRSFQGVIHSSLEEERKVQLKD